MYWLESSHLIATETHDRERDPPRPVALLAQRIVVYNLATSRLEGASGNGYEVLTAAVRGS
eukprot:1182220-Prorocentrum_minimum.AAC.1